MPAIFTLYTQLIKYLRGIKPKARAGINIFIFVATVGTELDFVMSKANYKILSGEAQKWKYSYPAKGKPN